MATSTQTARGTQREGSDAFINDEAQDSLEDDEPLDSADSALATEELRDMIAEAAYYRAERRGFDGGFELEDWLEAEAEVRSRLASE
ncbi:MAG: DUF2934 domain-containing protein [Betaproteobacteria bacterium]